MFQTYITFNPDNVTQLVSNSDTQAVFYGWVSYLDICLLIIILIFTALQFLS